jgi:hypothetical protein
MIGRRLETKEHFDWLIQVRVTRCWSVTHTFSFLFMNLPELFVTTHCITICCKVDAGDSTHNFENLLLLSWIALNSSLLSIYRPRQDDNCTYTLSPSQ